MKKLISLLALLILTYSVTAQVITTICGTGVMGYGGDGGPATAAQINRINALYSDPVGLLYMCDAYNSRVRKIKMGGSIVTVAGTGVSGFTGDSGIATLAEINYGQGVVADIHQNVYFSDNYNQRIRKINFGTNIITTIAGTGATGYGGDNGPATAAIFNQPYGLTLDTANHLYIADQQNHRIRVIDLITGIITTVAGNGTAGMTGDGGPATAATINYPNYVHCDGGNNIYITDNGNHKIRKIDLASGNISTVAGIGSAGYSGNGGPATNAQLQYPGGITVDRNGKLYIADCYNDCVRMVDTNGIITTIAGTTTTGYSGDGGLPTLADMNKPLDIAVDSSLNVYVADCLNYRIRKITPPPSLTVCNVVNKGTGLIISPNPCHGKFTVEIPHQQYPNNFTVIITDIAGAIVASRQTTGEQVFFDIKNLITGTYIIRAVSANKIFEEKLEIK